MTRDQLFIEKIKFILPDAVPEKQGSLAKWTYKGWLVCIPCHFVAKKSALNNTVYRFSGIIEFENILKKIK